MHYEIEWQIPFIMPNKRVYFVDAFIKSGPYANTWIEIKGFFRNDAKEKWNWFHSEYPNNSQLWNKSKLQELQILSSKKKCSKLDNNETTTNLKYQGQI